GWPDRWFEFATRRRVSRPQHRPSTYQLMETTVLTGTGILESEVKDSRFYAEE
ncbi:hypothetical protein Dimus_000262, partial [Dionaea muscipula]